MNTCISSIRPLINALIKIVAPNHQKLKQIPELAPMIVIHLKGNLVIKIPTALLCVIAKGYKAVM